MLTTTSEQPDERRLSSVDVFCMQTYQPAAKDPLRRLRAIAVTLALVCLVLLASLGFAVSRGNAMERERDALSEELGKQRTALVKTGIAAKDVEMAAANYALETTVRRDIVDERMLEQERRSAELAQLAEKVEREKLVRADCVTPRSILAASNL
jgi:Na+-transporting NADH:ubiquinone oxidoreductase subunit NqrC